MFLGLVSYGLRNIKQTVLTAHPRWNLLYGANGAGKTTLLEALYLLSTLSSFRTHRLEELITAGQEGLVVDAHVQADILQRRLRVVVTRGTPIQKRFYLDGKEGKPAQDLGTVRTVLFVPEDLQLVRGSPADRRSFLDRAVWTSFPGYMREVQAYNKALKQRNAALRMQRVDLLDVFDSLMVDAAATIVVRRRDFLKQWSSVTQDVFAELGHGKHIMALQYKTICSDCGEDVLKETLLSALLRRRKSDLQRGFTSVGPHTDDLDIHMDGLLARTHASQGQTRTLLLSAKMAEIKLLQTRVGVAPVLLLDDVASELDEEHRRRLFFFIDTIECQTFITATDPGADWVQGEGVKILVQDGQIGNATTL